MGFSADAIGFLLQLDDQLTPGLAKAGKAYAKFTKDIDRYNQKTVKSVGKAFAQMASLAESFEKMPQMAAASYRKTAAAVQRQQKPMKVKVELTLSGKRLDREIANAVTSGMRGAARRNRGGGAVGTPAMALPVYGPAPSSRTGAARAFQAQANAAAGAMGRNYVDRRAATTQSFSSSLAGAMGGLRGGKVSATSARDQVLATFAALPKNERKARLTDMQTAMKTIRMSARDTAAAARATTLWGRAVNTVKRGFGGAAANVAGIARDAREVARNTRFSAIMTAIDRAGRLFANGNQFFQSANNLNKDLHLTRKELAKMEETTSSSAPQMGIPMPGPVYGPRQQGPGAAYSGMAVPRTGNYMDNRVNAARAFNAAVSSAAAGVRGGKMTGAQGQNQILAAFAAMPKNERKARMDDLAKANKMIREAGRGSADAARSTTLWGRAVDVVKRGFGGTAASVSGIARETREIARNTRFSAVMTAIDRAGQLFSNGNQFFQSANNLNKDLHLTRKELAKMEETSIDIANGSNGALSSTDAMDAMQSLAKFGTRARQEFEALTPTVAMATAAMNLSGDTAAGLARKLSADFKMSKGEVADTFADIGRISASTGVGAEDLAGSMTSNASSAGAFLQGLSPGERKGVLGNMASLQGVLTKNFGDSGGRLGSLMSAALSDAGSDEAKSVANLIGLTGGSAGSLAAALKSGDLSRITDGLTRGAAQAGTNSTAATQLAQGRGFPGTGGEYMKIGQSGSTLSDDLRALSGGAIAPGTGMAALSAAAGNAMSDIDKAKNKVQTWVTSMFPAAALQFLSEISSNGASLLGAVHVLSTISRAIGTALGVSWAGVGAAASATAAGVGAAASATAAGVGAAASSTASVAARTAGAAVGRGAMPLVGGILGGAMLALMPTPMGGAEEDPGAAAVRAATAAAAAAARGPQTTYDFGQLQEMESKRLYEKQGWMANNLGGGADRDSFLDQATKNVQQVFGGDAFGKVPMMSPEDFQSKMASRPLTKEELGAAAVADAAAGRAGMAHWGAMGMGAGAVIPQVNSNTAPRPTPTDNVVSSFARSTY